MSQLTGEELYQLLPAIYRVRDAAVPDQPLRQLIDVLAEQAARVECDIDRLYENWFIETCDEWVVPYLADLLGVRGLLPPDRAAGSQRALVANTLRYRRRKGTLPVLEQLINDVAGWPARAVELFDGVGVTQHLDHIRPGRGGSANLRDTRDTDLSGSAFDPFSYTPDIRVMAGTRPVAALEAERPLPDPGRRLVGMGRPRPNLPNVALFVWRLRPFRSTHSTAYDHGKGRFSFSPIGNDIPLFNSTRERDFVRVSQAFELPVALRRSSISDGAASGFVDDAHGQPFGIYDADDTLIPFSRLEICNLRSDTGGWATPTHSKGRPLAYVDPQHGRIQFRELERGARKRPLRVSFTTAFADTLGGGDYDRRRTGFDQVNVFDTGSQATLDIRIEDHRGALDQTLELALSRWRHLGQPDATITIDTDATVARHTAADWLQVDLNTSRLTIRAANLHRPVIIGDVVVCGASSTAELTLSGLMIAGQVRLEGRVGKLTLVDCTLVPGCGLTQTAAARKPGRPSLLVNETLAQPSVLVDHCIVGPLRIPASAGELVVRDSIVDAPEPSQNADPALPASRLNGLQQEARFGRPLAPSGSVFVAPGSVAGQLPAIAGAPRPRGWDLAPSTCILRSTIFGAVHVAYLPLAEDALFTASMTIGHPEGSIQRNCALQESGETAAFTAACYAQPGYAQLSLACAPELRTGGTDGAEIGVFHNLRQPQREGALLAQLEEYLRFGLEAGIIYVT